MNIHDEITTPGQEARHGNAPAWLTASPTWPAVRAQTDGGQLYLHQAMGLELVGQGHNLLKLFRYGKWAHRNGRQPLIPAADRSATPHPLAAAA